MNETAYRSILRRLRAELPPPQPEEVTPLLAMSLDVFARADALLEVRVPWLDGTLWMVPTDQDGDRLMAEGVSRGRIWTAGELIQLMAFGDRTPETAKTITHAKLAVDGQITEVRPRGGALAGWDSSGDGIIG
jgi:hypothetical protein